MFAKIKTVLVVVSLLFCVHLNAQETAKPPVKEGVITLYTDVMLGFTNLQFVGENVIFTNIATNVHEVKPITSVQRIQDDNQKTLYEGGKFSPEYNKQDRRTVIEKPKPVAYNDTLFRPNYPAGVYYSKEDFIAKNVTKMPVTPRELIGLEKDIIMGIKHACFFYINDKRIKNAFAISYQGHLYFCLKAVLKNRNKTDGNQTTNFENSFVRVILGGDNYFYTEADLSNVWAQGLAYGAVGGATGGALARSAIHGKGIVWDFKNAEFNIFKNCKDYNNFIQPLYPQGVQECKNNQPDNYAVRQALDKIK